MPLWVMFACSRMSTQGNKDCDGANPVRLPLSCRAWMLVVSLATSLQVEVRDRSPSDIIRCWCRKLFSLPYP